MSSSSGELLTAAAWTAGLLWLICAGAATAACPATPGDVQRDATEAAMAFADMDAARFNAARGQMLEDLSCVSAAPSSEQAALVHQAEALAWFQLKDTANTLSSLQAMHESDSGWTLGPALAPRGGPLSRRDAEAMVLDRADRVPLEFAPGWTAVVDGQVATDRPVGRVAWIVIVTPDGRVAWSALLAPGEALPSVGLGEGGLRMSHRQTDGSASAWWVASGGAALVAGGLWAGFIPTLQRVRTVEALTGQESSDADWQDAGLEPMSSDEVVKLAARARTLERSAEIASGAAVGLCVVALVHTW